MKLNKTEMLAYKADDCLTPSIIFKKESINREKMLFLYNENAVHTIDFNY